MEIILQQNYPSLGYVGERVSVRSGYARNYLIPRGIGVEVESLNSKQLRHQLTGIEARRKKLKTEAETVGEQLAALQIEFTLKIGEKGKSFGSIGVRDVERELNQKGFKIERKQIRLLEPLRGAGDFQVMVRLHSDVEIAVPVKIVAEVVKVKVEESDGRRPPRGRKGRDKRAEAPTDSRAEEDAEAGEISAE